MIWMRHNLSSNYARGNFMSRSASEIAEEILEMDLNKSCVLDMSQYPCTLEEIGQAMGITRERVRQIENGTKNSRRGGAVGKLRHKSRRDYLKDFIGAGKRGGPDIGIDDWMVRFRAER
jgi:hypothetical protein